MRFHISFLLLWSSMTLDPSMGLMLPSSISNMGRTLTAKSLSSSSTCLAYTKSKLSNESAEEMKQDIEKMRMEAIQRLEALNEKIHQADAAWQEDKQKVKQQQQQKLLDQERLEQLLELEEPVQIFEEKRDEEHFPVDLEADEVDALYQSRLESDSVIHQLMEEEASKQKEEESPLSLTMAASSSTEASTTTTSPLKLLEDTRWRLMLNIGREPGTWMPKTWGVSGERLYMNLELEFSPEQLYEREEFLNGVSGAKVLKVVHDEAMLSPTMQEGGRQVRVRAGGWRVAPGEGPMGTSVLRFYFELEEETRHKGSDVYLPAGRVYCTCGYFPMKDRQGIDAPQKSIKEALRKQMRELENRYEELSAENELDTSLVSWEKVQRAKELMNIRMSASKLRKQLHEAQVREPEKSLLRLSRDQSVGLTREGGVCCKVHKGLAIEYHILGKLELASMENREHTDYRELLSP